MGRVWKEAFACAHRFCKDTPMPAKCLSDMCWMPASFVAPAGVFDIFFPFFMSKSRFLCPMPDTPVFLKRQTGSPVSVFLHGYAGRLHERGVFAACACIFMGREALFRSVCSRQATCCVRASDLLRACSSSVTRLAGACCVYRYAVSGAFSGCFSAGIFVNIPLSVWLIGK